MANVHDITMELDKIADELQNNDPLIAKAIDVVSDKLEKQASLDGLGKDLVNWLKDIKQAPKDSELKAVIDDILNDPRATPEMSKFVALITNNKPLTEKEASMLDLGNKMVDWIKSIKGVPKDTQLAGVIELISKDPAAGRDMSKVIDKILGDK